MKFSILTLVALVTGVLFLPSQQAFSQGYIPEKVKYFDAVGSPTLEKKAVRVEQILQFDDTLWEHNLYRVGKPMYRSERFSDPEGKILNGRYLTYNEAGNIDTFGNYSKGKRSGYWDIYSSQGRLMAMQFYDGGELIWTMDSVLLKQESDSNTFINIDVEAEFSGGPAGWLRYLNKHSHYPDYAVMHKIMGTPVIAFIVDAGGQVVPSSALVYTSVEFHLDREASRLIFQSPDWTPAVQNGKNVKSYKKQPIIFRF
jgi:hypothetical protein